MPWHNRRLDDEARGHLRCGWCLTVLTFWHCNHHALQHHLPLQQLPEPLNPLPAFVDFGMLLPLFLGLGDHILLDVLVEDGDGATAPSLILGCLALLLRIPLALGNLLHVVVSLNGLC